MHADDPLKNILTENTPVDPKKDESGEKKKSAGVKLINNTLRSIGFSLLFFFLGGLIVGLVLYLPADSKLRAAEAELSRLYPIEEEFIRLTEDYSQVSAQRVVYKMLSNASLLQIALENNTSGRINQYIRYIEEDLLNLTLSDFPDIPASLTDQFRDVTEKVSSDRPGALRELQSFQNDLLLLMDNLE